MERGKLLNPTQIAKIYGIPRGYLYSWIKRRCIPHVKPSQKSVLVYEGDLRKFLAEKEVKAEKRKRIEAVNAK